MRKKENCKDVSIDTSVVTTREESGIEEINVPEETNNVSCDNVVESQDESLYEASGTGESTVSIETGSDSDDVALIDNTSNDIALKESDDVLLEEVALNKSEVSRVISSVLDEEAFLEAVPLFGWNKTTENNGYDVQNCKVLCPEVFLLSPKLPNSYIPKLDRALAKAREFANARKDSSACPEMAEFYGKYCSMFLRIRICDIGEEYKASGNFPEYPCLLTAVDLLNNEYNESEVKAFWLGFLSEFPIGPEEIEVHPLSLFAKTTFGYILVNQLLKVASWNFAYYVASAADFQTIKLREASNNTYSEIDLEKCLY